jgi:hypothetical protein
MGTLDTPSFLGTKIAGDTFSNTDSNTLTAADQVNDDNIEALIGSRTYNDTVNNIVSRVSTLEGTSLGTVHSVTADYVILDDDGYGVINVNPTAGNVTVTLPTAADNADRPITVKVTHIGGKVTLDGEGAETIDGELTQVFQNKNDFMTVYCDGTGWYIRDKKQTYDTGWVNRSSYTTIHHGSTPLTYDNLTGTYTIGERIIEYSDAGRTTPTGVEGIIQADTGTALKLKNVEGGGIFTNNFYLKGETSGATSIVNEAAGSNKNINSDLFHEFGKNLNQLKTRIYGSTDGTENNSFEYIWCNIATTEFGWNPLQTDTNNLTIPTGNGGLVYKPSAGAAVVVDAENWYIRSITEVR